MNHEVPIQPSPQLRKLQARAGAVQQLLAQFTPRQRLCYYPSSGYGLLWAVMQLDCDVFIFSDKDNHYNSWSKIRADFASHRQALELMGRGSNFVQFRSGQKIGLLLWEDNNLVLDHLHEARLQVHQFVGICDGCCEGGNYECVHERPFIRRLMRVAANGMHYATDHSRPLQKRSIYNGWGMHQSRKFLEHVMLDDFPEPPHWARNHGWYEPLPHEVREARFELQGVLIRPDDHDTSNGLAVLPKGSMNVQQLETLRPFRSLAGRGILAEYRVSVQRYRDELGW